MEKTFYIIVMKIDGIPYYLHNNVKFYNGFINSNIKAYKSIKFAKKKYHEICSKRPHLLVNIIAVKEGQEIRNGVVIDV